MASIINNPFGMYPQFPMCGYNNYDLYKIEIIRFFHSICELKNNIETENKKIFFHLGIGAAAEELFIQQLPCNPKQWIQLFPIHLQNTINKNIPIVIYIVSPNTGMTREYTPEFIKQTEYLDWEYRADEFSFDSRIYKIKVKIFNCPMPSKSDYTERIEFMRKNGLYDEEFYSQVTQTSEDKTFIDTFYDELDNLFNAITTQSGFVTCFSTAVFNNGGELSRRYNDYYLIKEIKELFIDSYKISNKLLAEWVYDTSCFSMYEYHTRTPIQYGQIMDDKQKLNVIDIDDDKLKIIQLSNNVPSESLYDIFLSKCDKVTPKAIKFVRIRIWETIIEIFSQQKIESNLMSYLNNDIMLNYKKYIIYEDEETREKMGLLKDQYIYDICELYAFSKYFKLNIKIYDYYTNEQLAYVVFSETSEDIIIYYNNKHKCFTQTPNLNYSASK